MKKALLTLIPFLVALGCTTAPKPAKTPETRPSQPKTPQPQQQPKPLDPAEVQAALRMNRSPRDLGFQEKRFNACQLGLRSTGCRDRYLSVIHFRLMCRDSVGTVQSVSNIELIPVSSSNVKWTLGLYKGRTHLDSEGFGQIRVITPGSSRSQKLSLIANGHALGVSAADITRVIVPKDWCE